MKKFFNKDNFICRDFDKKQRRQSWVVLGVLAIFFIISSFTFMNMLYSFVDCIGSIVSGSADVAIKDLLRNLPLFLVFFMSLWTLLLVHAFYRNASDERRNKSILKNSITILVFALVNIIYIFIGRFTGKYYSLAEGSPSPIFPLDSIIFSAFYIVLAICALLYGKKYQEVLPYVVPSRGPIVTKARFLYCLFVTLWMLFSLFCFSGFFIGWFVIDFIHGYLAFSIALLCCYCLNAAYFIVWELYYNNLKEEKRKELLFPLALIGLCASVAFAAFYFVALSFNLDGPANVGFGMLPIAVAASVNIATMVVVLLPLIISIVALIKGFKLRKK